MTVCPTGDGRRRARSCATLRARHHDAGGLWTLELSGEADLLTLSMLREELAHAVAMNPELLLLDVTDLRFCDVRCAHLILTARHAVPTTVIGAGGSVRRILDVLSPQPPGRR